MTIAFSKMQGLGNDFMVIDAVNQAVPLSPDRIRRWADRHFGIGFDQLLLVEPAPHSGADFGYRIFNADGGEVHQCGNGARCFARFVVRRGLSSARTIRAATAAGLLTLELGEGDRVTVAMGEPVFAPARIPFSGVDAEADSYRLTLTAPASRYHQTTLTVGAVALGNPHVLIWVDELASAPVHELGPIVQRQPAFPAGVNVGFGQRLDRHRLRLRVFERGVGETLACGSGACAAVAIGQRQGLLAGDVCVELPGGTLDISYHPPHPITMTGPAVHVFDGEIEP